MQRVVTETDQEEMVAQRFDPRAAIAGHPVETPGDEVHPADEQLMVSIDLTDIRFDREREARGPEEKDRRPRDDGELA